jgi:hypothetical protein
VLAGARAGTAHCEGCAAHAHEFPVTSERHLDAIIPSTEAYVLADAVGAETRIEVLGQLEHLRNIEPSAAHDSVHESYREWLVEGLAVGAQDGATTS